MGEGRHRNLKGKVAVAASAGNGEKKYAMGVWALALLNVAAIVSLAHFPTQAEYGLSIIFYLAIITPLVNTHFLADKVTSRRWPLGHLFALTIEINGNGSLMPVRDGPDDILGPPCRVAAKEDAFA